MNIGPILCGYGTLDVCRKEFGIRMRVVETD